MRKWIPSFVILAILTVAGAVVIYVSIVMNQAPAAPTSGPVEVGVGYRLTVACEWPSFGLGDFVWEMSGSEWPPELPDNHMIPYPVPGVLTLDSHTHGVFSADVD